jgi:hypothetical protein
VQLKIPIFNGTLKNATKNTIYSGAFNKVPLKIQYLAALLAAL